MTWSPRLPSLPLLARELTEQAARRRTFVIRTVYAAVLYGLAGFYLYERMSHAGFSIDDLLGSGGEFLARFTGFQLAGVYLLLPAITCGVMTSEKERDTLGLLLLTKLGPWTILWEKLLSRLFPMLMFLLLPLPLYAIAYSLGGVDTAELIYYAWLPLAAAFQVACFALVCSVWFRTTAGAFVASYVGGGVAIFIGSWLLGLVLIPWGQLGLFEAFLREFGSPIDEILREYAHENRFFGFLPLMAPWYLEVMSVRSFRFAGVPGGGTPMFFVMGCLLLSSALVWSGGLCLILARLLLWKRAFLSPGNPLMAFFRGLDRFFHRINENRVTRGIQLVKPHSTLPLVEPIAWMETNKRPLATLSYRVRILLVLMIPLLPFIALAIFDDGGGSFLNRPYGLAWPFWFVLVLLLSVLSSGLIAGERNRQTLDVLLSTPMTAHEILEQKLAGVWRLAATLAVPYATIVLWEIWHSALRGSASVDYEYGLRTGATRRPEYVTWEYVLGAVAFYVVYTRLIGWLGLCFSLSSGSRIRAILWTMGTLILVCSAGPVACTIFELVFGSFLNSSYGQPLLFCEILRWTSPVTALLVHERQWYVPDDVHPLVASFLHLAAAWLAVVVLRRRCHRQFGPATQRVEPPEVAVGHVRISGAGP